jgi:hypothetical protein
MVKHRLDLARVIRAPAKQLAESARTVLAIATREELINALQEAIQLEHGLMLQYLYAAMSCKRSPKEGMTERQAEMVRDWEAEILSVARDEMAHLATACNLVNAVGGSPSFSRPNFPQPGQRWFPFEFALEPLGLDSLDRFIRFESPKSEEMHLEAIAPQPITYEYVGELYRSISAGFATLVESGVDLFVGSPEVQDAGDWTANLRIFAIQNVASAQRAIDFIVTQGEGTDTGSEDSHYARFRRIREDLVRAVAADSAFKPARNVLRNPLTRAQRDAGPGAVLIDPASLAHPVAELFNHAYGSILLLLAQLFDPAGETASQLGVIQASARRAMSGVIRPLAEVLTTLPATSDPSGPRAGPSFELYGELRLPSYPRARWTVLLERIQAESDECRRLAAADRQLARLSFVARSMDLWRQTLTRTALDGGRDDA